MDPFALNTLVSELSIFGVKVELWMFMAVGMVIAVIIGLREYRRAIRLVALMPALTIKEVRDRVQAYLLFVFVSGVALPELHARRRQPRRQRTSL